MVFGLEKFLLDQRLITKEWIVGSHEQYSEDSAILFLYPSLNVFKNREKKEERI